MGYAEQNLSAKSTPFQSFISAITPCLRYLEMAIQCHMLARNWVKKRLQ